MKKPDKAVYQLITLCPRKNTLLFKWCDVNIFESVIFFGTFRRYQERIISPLYLNRVNKDCCCCVVVVVVVVVGGEIVKSLYLST